MISASSSLSLPEVEFFAHYCESVLGLRYLPLPAAPRPPRLVVFDLPSGGGGLPQNEMFQKMMAAIQLSAADYHVVECLVSEVSPTLRDQIEEWRKSNTRWLCFDEELGRVLAESAPGLVVLKGPRDLQAQSQSSAEKRQTWLGLQALAKALPSLG
jgi:hypothetical protein